MAAGSDWMRVGYRAERQQLGWVVRRGGLAIMYLMLGIVLAACGNNGGDAPASPVPTNQPAATPPPSPALTLGDVVWAQALNDVGGPDAALTEVPRNSPVVIAALRISAVQPGTSFEAAWTIDGNPIEALTDVVQVADAAESGWIAFTLTWNGPTLWPVGTLGVTIIASSGEVVTSTVQIVST